MAKDNRLKILQVGSSNWSENQEIPENMKWYYCNLGQLETLQEIIEEVEIKTFTAVIVDSLAGLAELMAIKEHLIPHAIFFDQTIEVSDEILAQFIKEMCAVPTDFSNQG
ncbi:MAG: accessory Sec system protein Asp2, partial [Streptococcus salivarius]|nr:accessory Sec system protein Asp2 [Streptococcus salivarius]